jgi:hypothetical protein
VKQVIEALVAKASGYRVRFSYGLVQVYSPAGYGDLSNPLNTTIETFDIANLPRQEAEGRLLGALVSKLSPGAGYGGDAAYGPEPQPLLTLRLKGARVFEILDAIVAADGTSIWHMLPASLRSPTPAQGPPWVVYDLRRGTERVVLERLNQLFR